MIVSQVYMLYLMGIMLLQLSGLLILCPDFAKSRVPDDSLIEKRIETTSNRSLTLTVAATAALAFLLRDISGKPELQEPILLIGFSLVLFGVSFGMDSLAGRVQLFFDAQIILLQIGLVTLIAGLTLSYNVYVPGFGLLLMALIIGLASLQILEFWQLERKYGIARMHLMKAWHLENTGKPLEAADHYDKAQLWNEALRVRGKEIPQPEWPLNIRR